MGHPGKPVCSFISGFALINNNSVYAALIRTSSLIGFHYSEEWGRLLFDFLLCSSKFVTSPNLHETANQRGRWTRLHRRQKFHIKKKNTFWRKSSTSSKENIIWVIRVRLKPHLTLMYERVQVQIFPAFESLSTFGTGERMASVQQPVEKEKLLVFYHRDFYLL